jgi:hypothetical protein
MSLYGNAVPLRESKMNAGDGGAGAGAAAEAAKTKKKPKKMPSQTPAESQVSKRNTVLELSDAITVYTVYTYNTEGRARDEVQMGVGSR